MNVPFLRTPVRTPKLPHIKNIRQRLTPFVVSGIVRAHFASRKNSVATQEEFLLTWCRRHARSEYGRAHHFAHIFSIEDFQRNVPINTYDDLKPWIMRMVAGAANQLIVGKAPRFATSSGTSGGGAKFIPVTAESLKRNHYKAGIDSLMYYVKHNPKTKLFMGPGIVIGGGFARNPITGKKNVGFISAILQKNAPLLAKYMKQPRPAISYLDNWETKVQRMVQTTHRKNITSISGSPAWCALYLERMLAYARTHSSIEHTHQPQNILDIWPHLELVMRGGMSIDLYTKAFATLLPSDGISYVQVYNASEGFFATQHMPDRDDMLLLIEHGIFYEFIPIQDYRRDLHKDPAYTGIKTCSTLEAGPEYVLIITNNAGLYRYVLGDVIVCTGLDPITIKVVGRTAAYIDVASECTPLEPIEKSIMQVAEKVGGAIASYHVAPGDRQLDELGFYEVVRERDTEPSDKPSPDTLAKLFDEALSAMFSYYHDERQVTHTIRAPRVHVVKPGTFYARAAQHNKLGGQHKVPKVVNTRAIIDELLSL